MGTRRVCWYHLSRHILRLPQKATNEALPFHELVRVVQWRLLGIERFIETKPKTSGLDRGRDSHGLDSRVDARRARRPG